VETLPQQIRAFLALPRETRTRERREAVLRALGVPHPSRFIEEVWTSQWEVGIDRLLDPANTRIRPLEPTDFHFKWALEAFNGLPASVRARLFELKVEANGLRGPILVLLDAGGLSAHEFEVVDLVALSKVHAEAAATVRIPDGRTCQFEVSHFAAAAEELYAGVARLFRLRATTYIHRLPSGGLVLLWFTSTGPVSTLKTYRGTGGRGSGPWPSGAWRATTPWATSWGPSCGIPITS
jgi:hypothetical protein